MALFDPNSVMVVAGEASSDAHAASLVRSLHERRPGLNVFGMGGTALRSAGMESVVDIEHAAGVMGFTEVFGSLGRILHARRELLAQAEARCPALVILVDYPDFNLSLARVLKKRGHRIVYFISPQLWAWRSGRINRMKRDIDAVITIFPFENAFYEKFGMRAYFVGNPLVDRREPLVDRGAFLAAAGLQPDQPVVALLPGSRRAEVARLLPIMRDALVKLRERRQEVQGLIPVASTLDSDFIERLLNGVPGIACVEGQLPEVVRVSDAALVASGTATVEATIAKIPFAVVYRLSWFSYRVARFLVRGVKYFAMPNLIAGERVVTELLQSEVTPERLERELHALLHDEPLRRRMQEKLGSIRELLKKRDGRNETACERAAEIVLSMLPDAKDSQAEEETPRRVPGGAR